MVADPTNYVIKVYTTRALAEAGADNTALDVDAVATGKIAGYQDDQYYKQYEKYLDKSLLWVVDPIDGTMNFLNGIPQFAISIGYEEDNEIKCGVIFNPITNEMSISHLSDLSFSN